MAQLNYTKDVFILGASRTPIGTFQGSLSATPAPKLGAAAIKGALSQAKVPASAIEEVILGNVLTAGEGQAPARQAALSAEIPNTAGALTINKVCGSGMKATMLAAQSILLGESRVSVAGGMENMSLVPYLLPQARAGMRLGHSQVTDAMILDGLWDPYNNQHMGNCAELCAKEKLFTREMQDAYAIQSFKRAQNAIQQGLFKQEITDVSLPGKKGETLLFSTDEGPGKAQFDKIPSLRPVFDKNGTVTAANASTINDGAAALILASQEFTQSGNYTPLARIVSHATSAADPVWFTTAPVAAMKSAIKAAGWQMSTVDLFEVNEAFAVVALYAQKELDLPADKLNVHGGAISLGHPIGCSGARILVTLIHALKQKGLKRGLAGICIGGGEATAVCLEIV